VKRPFIASVEIDGPFKVNAESFRLKAEGREAPLTGEQITTVTAKADSSRAKHPVASIVGSPGLLQADIDELMEHTTNASTMWLSEKGQTSGWIEFDLGQPEKIDLIEVWNFNEKWHTNRGVKSADISVWSEGPGWKKLYDDFAFDEAEGTGDYDEPALVKLGGVDVQKLRFDDLVNFGDPEYVGLSKVRFFGMRGARATRPRPADGGDFVIVRGAQLRWAPGVDVKRYRVYLGTDPNNLELLGRVRHAVFEKLPRLKKYQRYYWRVDSVASGGSVVEGRLWSFMSGQLVGWWKFDDGLGAVAYDSSGKGHHGLMAEGKPIWDTNGKQGGCLDFDLTFGVHIPRSLFDNVSAGITVSVWANGDAEQPDQTNVILQAGAGDTGRPYILTLETKWKEDGRVIFKTGRDEPDRVRYNAKTDEWAGKWNHYVFVKDAEAGAQRIYLNGEVVAEKTDAAAKLDGITAARIGMAPDRFGDQYIGKLDELRIYSYPLREADVKALHEGKEPQSPAPVAVTFEPEPGAGNWIAVLAVFVVAVIAVTLASRRRKPTP
jgi:hypothetical protein